MAADAAPAVAVLAEAVLAEAVLAEAVLAEAVLAEAAPADALPADTDEGTNAAASSARPAIPGTRLAHGRSTRA